MKKREIELCNAVDDLLRSYGGEDAMHDKKYGEEITAEIIEVLVATLAAVMISSARDRKHLETGLAVIGSAFGRLALRRWDEFCEHEPRGRAVH